MTNEQAAMESCPFWSAHDLTCGIHSEGIFIPLDADIQKYCTTGSYGKCPVLNAADSTLTKTAKKSVPHAHSFPVFSQESQN